MNPNDAAFPHESKCVIGGTVYTSEHSGLTKRELMAIENHAQLIRFVQRKQMTSEEAAELAVWHTDALIRELGKGAKK